MKQNFTPTSARDPKSETATQKVPRDIQGILSDSEAEARWDEEETTGCSQVLGAGFSIHPVASYLRQIGRLPLLSRAEELVLASRMNKARRHLLGWILCTRVAIHWLLTRGPEIGALNNKLLPEPERTKLRQMLALADRCFDADRREPSLKHRAQWRRSVFAIKRILRGSELRCVKLNELFDELWAIEKRFANALERLRKGDLQAEEEIQTLENASWLPASGMGSYFNKIRTWLKEFTETHNRLFASNLRLVVLCAKPFQRSGMPLLDLVQEGNIALMVATEFYKPEIARFSTFAKKRIDSGIQRGIDDTHWSIGRPVKLSEDLRKIKKMLRTHSLELDWDSSSVRELIASLNGFKTHRIYELRVADTVPQSLDANSGNGGQALLDELDRQAFVVQFGQRETSPADTGKRTNRLLHMLTVRQRQVIARIYGLDEFCSHSERMVALDLKISLREVQRIHAAALSVMSGSTPPDKAAQIAMQETLYGVVY